MKKYRVLVLLCSCIHIATAQMSIVKHYTSKEGLPHDITYQIIQDSLGFIWVGTDDGLTRFNGETFTNYRYQQGLTSNYVIDVITYGDSLLLGTWGGGLHIFYNDTIVPFTAQKNALARISKLAVIDTNKIYAKTFSNYSLYDLPEHTMEFYVFNDVPGGLEQVHTSTWNRKHKKYATSETIINHKIWVYSSEDKHRSTEFLKGIYTIEQGKLVPAIPGFDSTRITALTEKQDTLFFASRDTIYSYYDRQLCDSHTLSLKGDIFIIEKQGSLFYVVARDPETTLRELFSFNTKTGRLTNLSKEWGIQSMISDIMLDRDQNLWVTTYGQGIFLSSPSPHTFLGSDHFENPDLKDLISLNDSLFVLATNKAYVMTGDTIADQKTLSGHAEQFSYDPVKKRISFPVFLDTYRDKELLGKTSLYYQTDTANKITTDRHFKKEGYHLYFSYLDTVIKKNIAGYEIIQAKSTPEHVFINYFKKGLYMYNRKGDLLKIWNKVHGLLSDKVNDFVISQNGMYLATDSGLFLDTNPGISTQNTKPVLLHYSTDEGLTSNHINTIFLDAFGVLWIGTQNGLNALKDDIIYTLDETNGQKSSFITKVTGHQNHIYVAGNKGLFKIKNAFHPTSFSKVWVVQDNNTFKLKKVNFKNHKSLRVQYQLNADEWIETDEKTLQFANLRQGNYSLHFRYKDQTSDWRFTPLYTFSIQYPWYTQFWFYALLLLGVSSAIIRGIYKQLQKVRYKNRMYQKTLEEREQLRLELNNVRSTIAKDFHDDIGNKLASISVLSNLSLEQAQTADKDLKNKLQKIKNDANFLYTGMRDFIWALDVKNNTLAEVQSYLNDFGERFFENSGIAFYSYNELEDAPVQLPHYWNKQIILIFKEAMTNTLKHSNASICTLTFSRESDLLEITFRDNGTGFQADRLQRKNGLLNMQKRAEKIGVSLTISQEDGVKVHFKGMLTT